MLRVGSSKKLDPTLNPSPKNNFFQLHIQDLNNVHIHYEEVHNYHYDSKSKAFQMVFELSQSLVLVGQPTESSHVCMIITRDITLATTRLLSLLRILLSKLSMPRLVDLGELPCRPLAH